MEVGHGLRLRLGCHPPRTTLSTPPASRHTQQLRCGDEMRNLNSDDLKLHGAVDNGPS